MVPTPRDFLVRKEWIVGNYLDAGQTVGDAPGILCDWGVVQLNGLPTTKAASAIVAITQSDPARITRIYPFGSDLPTGQSWASPEGAVDPEVNMVFSADQNMFKIAGIRSDAYEFHIKRRLKAALTVGRGASAGALSVRASVATSMGAMAERFGHRYHSRSGRFGLRTGICQT